MKSRLPIQSKSTDTILRTILPESFKMVNDKTSNGYKYINLLFGVEVDQARDFMKEVYDNSFLTTMDFGIEDTVYEVYLSGLAKEQYLNSSGTPIKIVNNGSPGGESEFWGGDPTRVVNIGIYDISGIVASGHIIGLNYFRINSSGYGYFLIGTDIDQEELLDHDGSEWRVDLNTTGSIIQFTGLWPGVADQVFERTGADEILTPKGSGFLSKTYPLTRRIRDDSGVFWDIDAYEPYHGWVRDPDWNVVAKVDYLGDFFYNSEGIKTYYRIALNNPYGSGNFTTEYIRLNHVPIEGTLRVYDIDILDISGNATEIPKTGKELYRLKSDLMLNGTGLINGTEPQFDPIYVGYDPVVPDDPKFGNIAGSGANPMQHTSWDYQREGGYLNEGTMTWVEGTGVITNIIKLNNPYSRYLVEYQYKVFNKGKYITSLDASKYVSFDTLNPVHTTDNVDNNEERVLYEFTKDPAYTEERSRFLTFDGWSIRPGSKISRIDFNIPLLLDSGNATLGSFQTRKTGVGYSDYFVPLYHPPRKYLLNCPFDGIVFMGCAEDDLSGSGNYLQWYNDGNNGLWRCAIDGAYGKTIRYVDNSSYYYLDGEGLVADNTFFQFEFRLHNQSNITLMELSQANNDRYLKVEIKENGMLYLTSNGTQFQSRYRFSFDGKMKGLIIKATQDRDYSDNLLFDVYIKDTDSYTYQSGFVRDTTASVISATTLHIAENSTLDIKSFKIWQEASTWQV